MKIVLDDGSSYDFNMDYPPDMKLSAETQMHGILVALRAILRCGEAESILRRAITVMRRADRLAAAHTEFGPI